MKRRPLSNRKGFTLAELLIVVAIIAVLVAIAIPILNKQLEKSREAHDIYTMRAAASAAIEMYYSGVHDEASARAAKLGWWGTEGTANANIYGAYDPETSTFKDDKTKVKSYGKGTTENAGTTFVLGNDRGAYSAKDDYRKAVVMVSIYPYAAQPYALVYWKQNKDGSSYVGGQESTSVPKYSIKINLN